MLNLFYWWNCFTKGISIHKKKANKVNNVIIRTTDCATRAALCFGDCAEDEVSGSAFRRKKVWCWIADLHAALQATLEGKVTVCKICLSSWSRKVRVKFFCLNWMFLIRRLLNSDNKNGSAIEYSLLHLATIVYVHFKVWN